MLKALQVLLDRFEEMDRVYCDVLALEGLAPGIDLD